MIKGNVVFTFRDGSCTRRLLGQNIVGLKKDGCRPKGVHFEISACTADEAEMRKFCEWLSTCRNALQPTSLEQ